jgi:hypothetical protein
VLYVVDGFVSADTVIWQVMEPESVSITGALENTAPTVEQIFLRVLSVFVTFVLLSEWVPLPSPLPISLYSTGCKFNNMCASTTSGTK